MKGAILPFSLVLTLPTALADAAPAYAPGRYLVDPNTTVHFQVKSLFGAYEGNFVEPSGGVVIDARRPDRAAIDIIFPVARMTTGDASTDDTLKSGSFFDIARYPVVRFAAPEAQIGSGNALKVVGQLTMHGQTHPIGITARLAETGSADSPGGMVLRFTGKTFVRRSQFGMGFGRPVVSNQVELTIDARFRPE